MNKTAYSLWVVEARDEVNYDYRDIQRDHILPVVGRRVRRSQRTVLQLPEDIAYHGVDDGWAKRSWDLMV